MRRAVSGADALPRGINHTTAENGKEEEEKEEEEKALIYHRDRESGA